MEPVAYTLSSLLADVSSIVQSAITWMTSFVNFITSNPIVLVFVIVSIVGLGIGLLRRVMGI